MAEAPEKSTRQNPVPPFWALAAAKQLAQRDGGCPGVTEASTVTASGSNSLEDEDRSSGMEDGWPRNVWPDTPDSTPPASPRGIFAAHCTLGHSEEMARDEEAGEGCHEGDPELPSEAESQVCDKLLVGLEDTASRKEMLDIVMSMTWPMASSPAGCRVVQRALEVAGPAKRTVLVDQMVGHVREAFASPHANYVLQKCIELLPTDQIQFVLAEMQGHASAAARHRYGCRVVERLLEHCSAAQTESLVDEVLAGTPQLCRHTFGNFVIQHVLEHGTLSQRRHIADVICADIQRLARHRVASHVVRCALKHCDPEDRGRLVQMMRADAAELADLAHHHCGSFVVREMRRGESHRKAPEKP